MTLYIQTTQKDGMGLKPEDGVSSTDRGEIVRNIIGTIERKHQNLDDEALNADETITLRRIAQRASEMAREHKIDYDVFTALMDLNAAQLSFKLRLDELLVADDFNFSHDVFGIRRHLNRKTLEIEDCFVPRFAVSESTSAST